MVLSSDDLAHQAAERLAPELDRNLPALVEAQIQAGGSAPERFEPGTVIALAALLLNAAKFAWDIYKDRKKEMKDPAAQEALARQLRLELKVDGGVSDAQRDKIIAVVVEELTRSSGS